MSNVYFDEDGNERLKCVICGRQGFRRLSSHASQVHPSIEYPEDTVWITHECSAQHAKNASEGWINCDKEARCKSISLGNQEQWARDYERMRKVASKSLADYRATPQYSLQKSEWLKKMNTEGRMHQKGNDTFKKLWSDPEWRSWKSHQQSEQQKQLVRDGLLDLPGYGQRVEYNGVLLRSSWELIVATELDSLKIKWEYEKFCIKYTNQEGEEKLYRPDFYLPDYNLILEVHPLPLIDEKMLCKRAGALSAGYNFLFITNPYIWDDWDKYFLKD